MHFSVFTKHSDQHQSKQPGALSDRFIVLNVLTYNRRKNNKKQKDYNLKGMLTRNLRRERKSERDFFCKHAYREKHSNGLITDFKRKRDCILSYSQTVVANLPSPRLFLLLPVSAQS